MVDFLFYEYFKFNFHFYLYNMTSIWGPTYWKMFHLISTMYPDHPSENDKKMGSIFLSNIHKMLPCPRCSKHYQKNLYQFGIRDGLKSKEKFTNWFIGFHNHINMMLGTRVYSIESSLNKIDKIDKDIVQHLDKVLEFTAYGLPKNGKINIMDIKGIQKFIKTIIYFGDLEKFGPFDLKFDDQKNFKSMHQKMIEKIKKNGPK
jgi:hypothetical protein